MKNRGTALTVGSLRGQPQSSRPVVAARVSYEASTAPMAMPRRRCCGSGCADCPIGRQIRARALGLPTISGG